MWKNHSLTPLSSSQPLPADNGKARLIKTAFRNQAYSIFFFILCTLYGHRLFFRRCKWSFCLVINDKRFAIPFTLSPSLSLTLTIAPIHSKSLRAQKAFMPQKRNHFVDFKSVKWRMWNSVQGIQKMCFNFALALALRHQRTSIRTSLRLLANKKKENEAKNVIFSQKVTFAIFREAFPHRLLPFRCCVNATSYQLATNYIYFRHFLCALGADDCWLINVNLVSDES